MAVAATKTKAPRTVSRDEPEAPRMEARMPERDPNKLYARDGREIDLNYIANQHNDDYTNLAAMGIVAPEGWVYEWRTRTVKNTEYTKGIVRDAKAGWTPVPASRHPGTVMPIAHEGNIEHDGQMLMERPAKAVVLSRQTDRHMANSQLGVARDMQGLAQRAAPNSGAVMDFNHESARGATGVRTERIPMGDPSKNYQYTLEE